MKTINVSISKNRITINGESQKPNNFEEAGLQPNGKMVTDRDEIEEYFSEKYEGEEIEVVFDDEVINFKMTHKNATIEATYTLLDGEENGKLDFQNPVSGSSSEDIDTVLWGWSEQDEESQAEWVKLIELAKELCDSELYWKINDGGVYEL